jgi:hypothetical protein
MDHPSKRHLVPYNVLSPGFEAVYTGEKSSTAIDPTGWPISRSTDDSGNVIETWSVWTWKSDPLQWDQEIRHINMMQEHLGFLDDDTRQIRAHIGSLVLCESGIPLTIDDLLAAIGRGRFLEPPLHDGCWCCGMWWQCRGTQHGQPEAMAAIERILVGYLEGRTAAELTAHYPDAEGFIHRAYGWLPPVSELSQVQRLMIERILLPFAYWTGRNADYDAAHHNSFGEGGRGAYLDGEIAALAGLPPIYPEYKPEFASSLEMIDDPPKRELYRICAAIAHGLHGLSDCHHSAFRWIERWVHDIGTLSLGIPERRAGVERQRLAQLLFGYTLALDKWLLGRSMHFLLLDLAYVDLGFDPKNEILRVYAHLGATHSPVKEWLAACLWKGLSGAGNPRGWVIQNELLACANERGVSAREWMDGQLAGRS